MNIRIVSPDGHFCAKRDEQWPSGTVVDVDDGMGAKLVRIGVAVAAPAPVIETAATGPPENTAKRVGRPKPRTQPPPRK